MRIVASHILQIVHLVRDPRGIISSRGKISRKMEVETVSTNLCQKLLDDRKIKNSVSEER